MKPGGPGTGGQDQATAGQSKALASLPPLESHLVLLTGGPRGLPPRQQMLHTPCPRDKPDYVSPLRVKLSAATGLIVSVHGDRSCNGACLLAMEHVS